MEQFEKKEEENVQLKQQLKEQRLQVMSVRREKLEQEAGYVGMMEQVCQMEDAVQQSEMQLKAALKELEEAKKQIQRLEQENKKVVWVQPANDKNMVGSSVEPTKKVMIEELADLGSEVL